MTKIIPLALHAACTAALALMATGASAQTPPVGRTAFDEAGCRSCHAYSSRRGAPSVRDMLASFEGEPESALKGIEQTTKHASDPSSSAVTEKNRKLISEWLANAEFPEPEAAPEKLATSSPPPPPPAAVAALVQPALEPLPTAASIVAPPLTAVATIPSVALVVPVPAAVPVIEPAPSARIFTNNLTGLIIEPGAKGDQLIVTLSGKTPDDLDIQSIDGQLTIRLPAIGRAASVPTMITANASSRAVSSVHATQEGDLLTLTVTARSGDLKYTATQGRNRILVDLTTIPSKKRAPVAVATAPLVTPSIAPKPLPIATLPSGKIKAQDTEKAAKKPAPLPTSETVAKATPSEDAKTTKQEAKVKQEVVTTAQAKKEAEEKAAPVIAKKEVDDKARRETAAAGKAEADMLAALTASAEALKKGSDAEVKVRKDRSKMKAPDKFRDEACPPIGESEPIGTVDVEKAKDIIERVGCPQCHAFVQKKTGPPFKRVFEKVKGNSECVIARLKNNKEHNDEGVTDELKSHEFKIVADYLATRAK